MSTLQENLDAIKLEKDTKILPENLKSGITAFGVNGTLQPGSGTITTLTITDPEIPGFTPEYEVSNVSGYDYGFSLVDSKYQNTNQNKDNTDARCKVLINTPYEFDLILHLTQDSENGCDYGRIYGLDSESSVITQFNGKSGSFDYTITIPSGEHYLYISYIKDGSVANGTDTFTFALDFSNCVPIPEKTYNVSVMHFANKEDMLADTTCPIDTFAIVYGYGRNLQSELWRKTENGWVFTGVNNDPNLIPKNILRGIKIGEIYGGYIQGYATDDLGNIKLNVNQGMYTTSINGHTNSFCFISAYLDPLDKIHIQLQYETYAELPMKFKHNTLNITQLFTVPNSEGVTSTMELIVEGSLNATGYWFNAYDNIEVNITFEKIKDLDIELNTTSGVNIPGGVTIGAELYYNADFNSYKYKVNLSHSGDISDVNNKSVKINFKMLEMDAYHNFSTPLNSTNTYTSPSFSTNDAPTKLYIDNIIFSYNYYNNYETINKELNGNSYTYNVSTNCTLEYSCNNEHKLTYILSYGVNGELSDTLFARLSYTNLFNDVQYLNNIDVSTSGYNTKWIYLNSTDYNITENNFFSNTYSTTVNLDLIEVTPEDVLTSNSYTVYNATGMEVETISNLVVNGDIIHGYTVTGNISFTDGSYTLSVYTDNTKSNMISSYNLSAQDINVTLPVFNTEGYDWNNLYFVILRPLKAVDSSWYDSENTSVTINDDGSASFAEAYSSSVNGATYQVTATITDISNSNYGGRWSELLTVKTENKDTFMNYFLSTKGYEKYLNGTLNEIITLQNNTWEPCSSAKARMVDKNGDTIGNLENDIFLQSPYKSSSMSHGNAPDFALLSTRLIYLEPVTHRENVTPLFDGCELSSDENGEVYYDNGTVYFTTAKNQEIYDFTSNGDGTYSKQVIISAYGYSRYVTNRKCWDADGNRFENKYMKESTLNKADAYSVFPIESSYVVHNVIVNDRYSNTDRFIAGTYQDPNGRTTKLQYELNGVTKETTSYFKTENNPLYDNTTVYYTYDGVITSANNPEEVAK